VTPVWSCQTSNRKSTIKKIGFNFGDQKYFKSIGAFSHQPSESDQDSDGKFPMPEAFGTGFIIGESPDEYFGLTNAHVWDHCAGGRPVNDVVCGIAFPDSADQQKWIYVKAEPYLNATGEHVQFHDDSGAELSGLYDFSLFKITKSQVIMGRKIAKLAPLTLIRGEMPQSVTFPTVIQGYPSGVVVPGSIRESTLLVSSSGVGLRIDPSMPTGTSGKYYDQNQLLFTASGRPGSSGSPVLMPYKDLDGRVDWAVTGILYSGTGASLRPEYINSEKSASRFTPENWGGGWALNLLLQKFPDLELWKWVKFIPVNQLAETRDLGAAEVSGKLGYSEGLLEWQFEAKVAADLDPSKGTLYINGVASKFISNVVVERSVNQSTKLSGSVKFEVPTGFLTPRLVFEFLEDTNQAWFTACNTALTGKNAIDMALNLPVNQIFKLQCSKDPGSPIILGVDPSAFK
jgi:hypothetical protein